MNENSLKTEIKNYITEASLGDLNSIKDDTLIFDDGLLDSMGLLFLVEFINEKYEITVEDEDLNPKNFESVNNIVMFISSKLKIV